MSNDCFQNQELITRGQIMGDRDLQEKILELQDEVRTNTDAYPLHANILQNQLSFLPTSTSFR